MAMTPAEQMLYSTVKLSTFSGSTPTGSGTGFFWGIEAAGGHAILLVTNKHVVEGADRVVAVCHIGEGAEAPTGKFANCDIRLDPEGMVEHPDPNVDLCAFGINNLLDQGTAAGTPLFFRCTGPSLIPAAEDWTQFDAIENVLMVGCPQGLYDQVNNLPIVRRGITATPLGNRYEGRDEFLVDMACFPGSSGSPVFIYDRDGYLDRKSGNYLLGASRLLLVGILYAGPQATSEGTIVLGRQPRIVVNSMMHLGQVIRSTALHELEAAARKRLPKVPA
jgi:hypothetical protein